jgi:predicted phosphoadenosine phosphosulfate sulfurtransferase
VWRSLLVLIQRESSIDVVEAAKQRIINIFQNNVPVYLSFSGGKDSICLAHLFYSLALEGKINPKQCTVVFIDEEAIYEDIEESVMNWRAKFLAVGFKFIWCCIEVRHYSCLNQLEQDESFMLFDRDKEQFWIRHPPSFAIRNHPDLKVRVDTYQSFLTKANRNGIDVIGTRVAESVQRLDAIARRNSFHNSNARAGKSNKMFPIYDWRDSDVWLYIKNNKLDYPIAYLYMWQIGVNKRELRISQFFSIDTVKSLVQVAQYYPKLMDKICEREPNAYLAALYFNSEMFRRTTKTRSELEKNIDYKKKVLDLLSDIPANFHSSASKKVARQVQLLITSKATFLDATGQRNWKRLNDALVSGDPKSRTLRAVRLDIGGRWGLGDQARRDKGEL